MHPVVQQLLALQQVDVRVASVQRKIDAIPRETARRRSSVDALVRERDELANSIRQAEAEYQDLEAKVRSLETALKRQQGHRDQAANASAFTAAQHQIEYLSQDKDNLQTQQLELMEKIEQQNPLLAEIEAKLASAQAEFAAYEAEARKLDDELQGQRQAIAIERDEFLTQVPQANLAMYEDLFHTCSGEAVVPAQGDHCSGCYTRLTPNDQAYLRTGATLITCKSCGRILFMPEP